MAIVSVDPDWARRKREMRSGCIALHKSSAFVARKIKWDVDNFVFRLSASGVNLNALG